MNSKRPIAPDVQPENIPAALRERAQWVLWNYWKDSSGKWTKPPYSPTGKKISITDPDNWMSFDEAFEHYKEIDHRFAGIGFALADGGGIAGIDLDGCTVDQAKELMVDTYTEISPSGNGVRQIMFGKKPEGTGSKVSAPIDGVKVLEVYDSQRYLTITGAIVSGYPVDLERVNGQLTDLCHKWLVEAEKGTGAAAERTVDIAGWKPVIADDDVLGAMSSASNWDKVKTLWDGDSGDDHSAADLALCNHLAFWCAGNPRQINSLFRKSGLMRDKWNKVHRKKGGDATYGQMTIEQAIASVGDVWSKNAPATASPNNLAAQKPKLADLWHTMDSERLKQVPVQRESLLGRFPVGCTSAAVAMGGAGKSTWLVRVAVEAAYYEGAHTVFITAEDTDDDYQAKLHNLIETESGQFNPANNADITGKIHVLNVRGMGLKLSQDVSGHLVPSAAVDEIIAVIRERAPQVGIVAFETLSRFAGGEENDHMEAAVTACDGIAVALKCAVVLVHHTGKGQARDKVKDLYTGRGGSTLGDNTRSFFVISVLDKEYKGEEPPLAAAKEFIDGSLIEVKHVRYSFGPTVDLEYFRKRSGYAYAPILEKLEKATDNDKAKAMVETDRLSRENSTSMVLAQIAAAGGHIAGKYFDSETKLKIGLSQAGGRGLIASLLEEGVLEEFTKPTGKTQAKFLRVSVSDYKAGKYGE